MLSQTAVAAGLRGVSSESSDRVDDDDITEGRINPHAAGNTAGQKGRGGMMPPPMMMGGAGAGGAQAGAAQASAAQAGAMQANAARAGMGGMPASAAKSSVAPLAQGGPGAGSAGGMGGAPLPGTAGASALGAGGVGGVGGLGATGAAGTAGSGVGVGAAMPGGVGAGASSMPGGVMAAGASNPDGTPSGYGDTGHVSPDAMAGGNYGAGSAGGPGVHGADGYAVTPEHLRQTATGWQAMAQSMQEADQAMQIPHDLGFANVAQGATNAMSQLTKLYAQQAGNEFIAIDRRLHGAAGEYDDREMDNARLANQVGRTSK